MPKAPATPRSYRCFFNPRDRFGHPVASDNGVLPYVQVRAINAEHAQRAAHHVTGCPVASVERLEAAAA